VFNTYIISLVLACDSVSSSVSHASCLLVLFLPSGF
jgi:hypothetical protein